LGVGRVKNDQSKLSLDKEKRNREGEKYGKRTAIKEKK